MIPRISVIVPIYNVGPYISRCLDSLATQTLEDIEIVLIDDGSTDGSGKIAERYAAQDGRFRAVHQPNRGLSAARNAGIELVSADYLMFVDGDDWVEPDFCRIPFEAALANGADMVVFRFWRHGFSDREPESSLVPEGTWPRAEAMSAIYHGAGIGVWNKLYHRSLFETIRFPEGRVFEDTATTYRLVHKAKSIFFSQAMLYHYCFRKDSIQNTKSIKNRQDQCEMGLEAAFGLRSLGYTELADERLGRACLIYLINMGLGAERSEDCLRVLWQKRRSVPGGSWRAKLLLAILRLSPRLFDRICVLFGKRIR